MKEPSTPFANLPPEQEAIRAKCFHPSGTFVEFPIDDVETSIPARFEKMVRMYPSRLAVKDTERSLTYDQLNRKANRIARAILLERGEGNDAIALLFQHGVDVIAAIFGVLKAGKFYVAIDPLFPKERIRHILKDSGASLLVTNRDELGFANALAEDVHSILNIDAINEDLASENLGLVISTADFVRINYTSGSTGKPKGVPKEHLKSLQRAMLDTVEVPVYPEDRMSLLHSVAYGSATVCLYQSLLNGASLFPFNCRLETIERLASWINEERITVLHLPPVVFRQLAETSAKQANLKSLRLIRLSGSATTRLDFELYRENFPPETSLEVHMGSTETGTITRAILSHSFAFPNEGVPIGYPTHGYEIFIVGENNNRVPHGEVGEIVVKGRNINSDYWGNPELTMRKHLPDPHGGDEQIYLTGDIGMMLPDGFLIHLGRKDLMVKIRGYRVNLNEVERALLEHFQIKEAGVAAWNRDPGEKYLVGYVVPRQESAVNVSELNEFLRKKIPNYMIPASFVFLKSLPLVNGKLDRTALPLPDYQRPDLRTPYVQPHGELQQKLSKIWAEVLSLDRIGAHDSFFDLGGHSLTATRLISRVIDSFQVEVSLKSLFESPTLTGFTQRVEDVLHQAHGESLLPLVPVPRGSSLPASFAQRGLWFHDQLEPRSCAYNLVFAYRLRGGLDVKALEQSVNQIIDRHEALRTVFEAKDGQPVQVIQPAMTIELPIMDLSFADSEQVRETEVRRIAGALAGQPFDLARGPLLRTALLRLADDDYVLLLATHHVVFDAWSMGIFVRELSTIYNSVGTGKPAPIPQLRIQYGDFAVWQKGRLQGINLENHLAYWKNQLDRLPALNLPSRRVQPVLDRPPSVHEEFELSKALSVELRRLCDCTGTTLFMVLLAAYTIALHRYTGQTDIAIGTPTAGRNHPEVEGLIGFFLNMLVLRTDLSGNPTFRELLKRIREVCLNAFAHQDLPFEKLVEELRPRRDLTQNPLIQVTFALQNTPRCPLSLRGVTARDLDISAGVARSFDLHLFLVEEIAGLRGFVSYNSSMFGADLIRRFIGHLRNVLEGIVGEGDQRISELSALTEPEKHQVLVEWNKTKREYPKYKCIHQLFEEQVKRTPEAVAVAFEDQQLTYRELNNRANQLAHSLKQLGVGPETLVGICVERSLEMVIGLLGILKAGGAYLPLDPNYPKERLEFMLADAQVKVVLTQDRLLGAEGSRRDDSDCRVSILDRFKQWICLDRDWELIARESEANPKNITTAENLAYVIYTSGSTGQPKGVMISHGAIANHMMWMLEAFPVNPEDRAAQRTPFSFDASVWEFFAPLVCGAQLVLASAEDCRDAGCLVNFLRKQRITILQVVPTLLQMLLEENLAPCTGLRRVFCGGEPLSVDLYARFRGQVSIPLINLYGPTEATIDATSYVSSEDHSRGWMPIGRPITNTEIYILDVCGNPVPIGVAGEIYIGGDGVARGYLNRPELTAEKFIDHSFNGEPARRLYKTGDRARYLPDGNIEFVGRIDNQVKIRGYRIELGEIEAVLGQHPVVQSSVVVVREDAPGDKRLVAYVVARPEGSFDTMEARNYLKQKLPEYMIPFQFVLLEAFPLTPNGKVDRNALPVPDQDRPELGNVYQAPRTPVEETLASIWSELLKVEKVGIQDNFFELGGHSLLATQVMSRVRSCLSVELPLRTLFESPTIEQMAAAIMGHRGEQSGEQELERVLLELEPDEEGAASSGLRANVDERRRSK